MGAAQWEDPDGHVGDDRKLGVRFELRAVKDEKASLLAGRPIFNDTEYIEIMTPGDRTNIPFKPVTDEHRRRFASQYQAWKFGQRDAALSGTPLKEWPHITQSQINELAHFHVFTVEQLSAPNDADQMQSTWLEALRVKAQDFLEAAKGGALVERLREENETMRRQLAVMAEAIGTLQANTSADKTDTNAVRPKRKYTQRKPGGVSL